MTIKAFRSSLLFLCCALLLALPVLADAAPREMSAREVAAMLQTPPEGLTIIDVRTPQEFNAGHVAGAKNIDFFGSAFEATLLPLDRAKPYLVYCRSGNRSVGALEIMQKLGFTNLLHMSHGMNEWMREKLPLTK